MADKKQKKARIFDLKRFPMDVARVGCAPLALIFRIKAQTPSGQKYRHKIRGGALVASNHYGFSDPLVLFTTFWYRRVFFLASEVVMEKPLRRFLMKGVGAIRIDRNIADMEAMRTAVGRMKEGRLLTIFPEGQLTKSEEVTGIKAGAVLMALQAGVPIYPMHIHPRGKWYRRKVVVIGDPIDPRELCTRKIPSTADIQRISDILMNEMNRCILKGSKEEVK